MSILNELSSVQGRRDEILNQELAKKISSSGDSQAIQELVEGLQHKNKSIQSNCIKVLYEIGEHKPELIQNYVPEFLEVLQSNSNRLVWGAMTALDSIALLKPDEIYQQLPYILDKADSASVIAKDHALGILIKLSSLEKYQKDVSGLLIHQLTLSAQNQFPMYLERSVPVLSGEFYPRLLDLVNDRLPEIEKESKRKRLLRVIRKIESKL